MWKNSTLTYLNVNYSYKVYQQDQANSCVPSCILMIAKLRYDKELSIGFVQSKIGAVESSSGNTADDGRYANFQTKGTYLLDAIKVFNKIDASFGAKYTLNPLAAMKSATENKPVICRVDWGENGHAIVCLGPIQNNLFVFLDPYYGIVLLDIDPSEEYPLYSTAISSFNNNGTTAFGGIDSGITFS